MQTVADMIHAFNELFLDFAPAAALIGLAVSWFFRNRRCRETERELRERIDFYRKQETGEEREGPEPVAEEDNNKTENVKPESEEQEAEKIEEKTEEKTKGKPDGAVKILDLDTGAEASFLHKTDPGAEEADQTEPEDSSEKKESGTQEAGAEETERKESETQESERKESKTQESERKESEKQEAH